MPEAHGPSPIRTAKAELRRRLRQVESADADPSTFADPWSPNLSSFIDHRRVRTLMAYLALPGEPGLDPFIDLTIARGIRVAVPRVDWASGTMTPVLINRIAEAIPGPRGVRTPPSAAASIDPASLELVLVPGLAFDRHGGRLGRGGGFYDRFLSCTPALRVGLCPHRRLVERVPTEPHDARMDAVLTERGWALSPPDPSPP